MDQCRVVFQPQNKTVTVNRGTTLLEAAHAADITINNICGGDGICGRCKMIVKNGNINAKVSGKLTREEIQKSYVLACMAYILSDLEVEIPEETLATEKVVADTEAERFRVFQKRLAEREGFTSSPLVTKIYLELEKPTLENNTSDHQRVSDEVKKKLKYRSMQMGLKILRTLPQILRESNYRVTATVGLRRDIAEIMNIEGGNFENQNYMVVVDMGTAAIVAHLVDANTTDTLDAKACFNSGGIYGREVTCRMIMAEKKGVEELQRLLVEDINKLIEGLAKDNNISLKNITAVVCAGNTAMGHFLLGLPTDYIRRSPYVPTSTAPPPLRAAEVGIKICPRGGILATGMSEAEELSLLIDIGTNGEIIIGNKDWLISCSASAGPALEGASVECGMRAERGAIEKVYREGDEIKYVTIGDKPPRGLCGSGIIDLVAVLLDAGIINRSGLFVSDSSHRIAEENGIRRFILAERESSNGKEPIYITESDIENIITAKAAIFAATKILLERLELKFSDIMHFYIAGAFGNYIDVENAVAIGLIPPIPRERIKFVGNTSIEGAKMVAFYKEAFYKIEHIRENCTYYDLMGANDFVEEFQKALFLPHTDIELFRRGPAWLRA